MSTQVSTFKKRIKELIAQEFKEVEEASVTGGIDGGDGPPKTPRAFTSDDEDDTKDESLDEKKLSSHQKKAITIAIEMSGNMTNAVKKIERIKKGLSKDKKVADALRLANESINEAKSLSKMNTDELIKYWEKESKTVEMMKDKKQIDKTAYRVESGKIARILNYLGGLKKDMKESVNEAGNEDRKWSMYVDDKKIKTYKSKRAAVIAYNKFMKDTDNWKEVSIKLESVNEAGTKSIDGEELLKYLQKRFKMSRKQAIASMKKHNMDVSSIKKESVNENGILYKAGVKKYGKEGMAKILSAAGKKKSHAEIGAIKDKYEKDKKESVKEAPNSVPRDILKQLGSDLNKISDTIVKVTNKYKNEGDIAGMVKAWMRGLHLRLKKSGIRVESVNEDDLGLTYKKGKTVKVTHKKSGKELVIVDKPAVRKEYEKIGFFAEGKVNEGKYHDYKKDESKTPKQKIGNSMREVRNSLNELSKLIDMNVKLKTEFNVDSQSYWKNTHKALHKISERLVKLANKVGQLQ